MYMYKAVCSITAKWRDVIREEYPADRERRIICSDLGSVITLTVDAMLLLRLHAESESYG